MKMPLKRLGLHPFLSVNEVENDDVIEIEEPPYIVPAEKTKWGRERGHVAVRVLRTGEIVTWTMNATTWDTLFDAFGEEERAWIGRKVRLSVENQIVRGETKKVIYGKPYAEPQQQLVKDPDKEFANLSAEEKNRALQGLRK